MIVLRARSRTVAEMSVAVKMPQLPTSSNSLISRMLHTIFVLLCCQQFEVAITPRFCVGEYYKLVVDWLDIQVESQHLLPPL